MPCSLIDLSDELLLKVIRELLKHDELLHEKSLEPDLHQSREDRDEEFQCHQDLMNWGCTSRYFRNLLAPSIFQSIKLRNNEKSGAFVDAVLKIPHGVLVKEIYFLGTVPPGMASSDDDKDNEPLAEGFYRESDEAEEEEMPITITLPPVVENLLSHLYRFPNLESLSIGFTCPYDNPFDEYYEAEWITENEDPEVACVWEALITTTYETLLRGNPRHLRVFEIRKFVWTLTEPYKSQSFQDFLNHVEGFTLSVRGGENGAGLCVNTCGGCLECVASFDELLFFAHLASATSLILRAPDEGPIGLEGMRHACLALKKER